MVGINSVLFVTILIVSKPSMIRYDRLFKSTYYEYAEKKVFDTPNESLLYKLSNSALKRSDRTNVHTLKDEAGVVSLTDLSKASILAKCFEKAFAECSHNSDCSAVLNINSTMVGLVL